MDDKDRFALRRFLKAYHPGPGELTRSERIGAAWRFTQDRNISLQEMFANLPSETASALREDAKQILEEGAEDFEGIICGLEGPWDPSNPNFIPRSFFEAMVKTGLQ